MRFDPQKELKSRRKFLNLTENRHRRYTVVCRFAIISTLNHYTAFQFKPKGMEGGGRRGSKNLPPIITGAARWEPKCFLEMWEQQCKEGRGSKYLFGLAATILSVDFGSNISIALGLCVLNSVIFLSAQYYSLSPFPLLQQCSHVTMITLWMRAGEILPSTCHSFSQTCFWSLFPIFEC